MKKFWWIVAVANLCLGVAIILEGAQPLAGLVNLGAAAALYGLWRGGHL